MATKQWALLQDTFGQADELWCLKQGVKVTAENLYNHVHTANGHLQSIPTGMSIRLETYNRKQETMLKLKYGNTMHLISG